MPPRPRRSISGKYDTVTCLDVMIHYPQDKVDAMIAHLAGLSERRLIISFAPKTLSYSILKRIGELFPGPSKVRWDAALGRGQTMSLVAVKQQPRSAKCDNGTLPGVTWCRGPAFTAQHGPRIGLWSCS